MGWCSRNDVLTRKNMSLSYATRRFLRLLEGCTEDLSGKQSFVQHIWLYSYSQAFQCFGREMTKKPPKCSVCRAEFTRCRPLQKVCGKFECIKAAGEAKTLKDRAKREQEERKKTRVQKEALKTRSDYIKEAQHAFNSYIRLRDAHLTCICCAQPLGDAAIGGGYDCGHYRSVGSAPHLRFDERNAHAQRKQCNRYGAGRAVDYRIGIISRLGIAVVEALESDTAVKKYTIDELKAIKATYKAKLKQLLADKEVA